MKVINYNASNWKKKPQRVLKRIKTIKGDRK